MEKSTGGVKPAAFRLRTSRGEQTLSFYDARLVQPAGILAGAPSGGWGVAAIQAGTLRSLGFVVAADPVSGELNGQAHVSAQPPEVDAEGQIPLELTRAISRVAVWAIRPG